MKIVTILSTQQKIQRILRVSDLREKLSPPSLTLDPIPDVIQGDDLEITGTTNRADGTYFIINVDGPGTDETATAEAADGSISATFDTTGWQVGSYHVTAEDIDNTCSDEVYFKIVKLATISIPDVMAKGIVTIPIKIEDAKNVGACQLTLTYDPTVAIVTDVIGSDSDNINANLENASSGKIRLNVFQGASPGLNGDVILADLNFTIVGDTGSSTSLNLYVEGLFDAEASSNTIPYKTDDGSIYVTLNGDVNNDDAVDISDCMYLAKHLLKIQGFETIDEVASDVNGDGEIDISDRMYLAKHLAGVDGFEVLI
ncbi:MAG: cohesin domain-containing protein [Halobacteriota archaeon]|nr:cohesin domain-containing protein [Halobacteriota archaeon]